MKNDIHPELKSTEFNCACGKSFTSLSVLGGGVHLDICAACHPFFTGNEKLLDTAGRIERFKSRYDRPQPVKDKAKPSKSSGQEAREKLVIKPKSVKKPRLLSHGRNLANKVAKNAKTENAKTENAKDEKSTTNKLPLAGKTVTQTVVQTDASKTDEDKSAVSQKDESKPATLNTDSA